MENINLTSDCPYCFTKNTFFTYLNEHRESHICYATFLCNKCKKVVMAIVIDNLNKYRGLSSCGGISLHAGEIVNEWIVEKIYPSLPKPKMLDYLPAKVSKYFIEAQEHVRNGHFETSVSICRKSLDIASVHMLEQKNAVDKNNNVLTKDELIKRPLAKRIDLLFDNNLITKDMHDWATIIREDGNDAVHSDEEFTQEEASELIDFTEMFLMYLYTLPQMVIEKRKTKN